MKHSAELAENGFTVLLKMELSEEVSHLKMHYVVEGFGLERSIGVRFRTNLETFPG